MFGLLEFLYVSSRCHERYGGMLSIPRSANYYGDSECDVFAWVVWVAFRRTYAVFVCVVLAGVFQN